MGRERRAGFTLVEIVFAVALLAIGALLLSISLASSQQMQALAREREVANNAVRAYIETKRQQYPDQSSTDMTGLLFDTQTPLDFLASGSNTSLEQSVLRNAVATVQKANFEGDSAQPTVPPPWGPSITTNSTIAPVSSTMTSADATALGLPRSLDSNSSTDQNPVSNGQLLYLPVKIEVSWTPNSGERVITNRQKVTVYAVFGPQH